MLPGLAIKIGDMILHMTVDKGDSDSGRQRLFWAMQGVDGFLVSAGLGVGPGSFRSSSMFTAILGTMGMVGVLTFGGYLWQITRLAVVGETDRGNAISAVMRACATTAPIVLLPEAIASPNAHPGTNFAIFGGAALALYAMRPRVRNRHDTALLVSRRMGGGLPVNPARMPRPR